MYRYPERRECVIYPYDMVSRAVVTCRTLVDLDARVSRRCFLIPRQACPFLLVVTTAWVESKTNYGRKCSYRRWERAAAYYVVEEPGGGGDAKCKCFVLLFFAVLMVMCIGTGR